MFSSHLCVVSWPCLHLVPWPLLHFSHLAPPPYRALAQPSGNPDSTSTFTAGPASTSSSWPRLQNVSWPAFLTPLLLLPVQASVGSGAIDPPTFSLAVGGSAPLCHLTSDPVSCSRPTGDLRLPADLCSSSNQAEGQWICLTLSSRASYWPPHLDRIVFHGRPEHHFLPAGSMTLEISHDCDRSGDGREEASVQRGRLSEIDSSNATASQRKAAPAGLLLQISDYDAWPCRLLSGATYFNHSVTGEP